MRSFFKKLKNNKGNLSRGFSLIELTVVLAIFAIMTTILIADIPNFREKSSLDLTVSEVATYIRGAQVYGAAQVGASNETVVSYGVNFVRDADNFTLFKNSPDDNTINSISEIITVETYELKGYKFSDFNVVDSDGSVFCENNSLSIIYETNPRLTRIGTTLDAKFSINSVSYEAKSYADVKIASKRNSSLFACVRVYGNGQITVVGSGECSTCE